MFKDNLKALRNERGLSQPELAKLLNVSQGTIGNWETGNRTPDAHMLISIADFFGVSIDRLLRENTKDNFEQFMSTKEKRVISAYRDNPDIQPAVDRLLKIEEPTLRMVPQEDPAQTTARMSAGDDVNSSTTVNSSIDERLALAEELKQVQKEEKNGKNKRNEK